ncbi:zinc metalloproteinase nas-13-like isoform X1 [Biomphalaria glabrata]|nr:zinc metalloproteinase nas-13-like isoform X1 [Biomphalaria glabrata]
MKFAHVIFIVVTLLILMTPQFLPLSSKSIDELIAGASEMSNFYLEDMEEGTIRRELDMVLTLEQYNSLYETNIALSIDGQKKRGRPRPRRKALRDKKYRWTNKEIPYRIVPNVFDPNSMREIRAAIAEWQNYTCITFRLATNSDRNFVSIDNGNGCYSYRGMVGGSQTVGLAGECRFKGVILHVLGHTIGFHHEHNRPDRDYYVTIIERNIPANLLYNFKKYPLDEINTYGVPYDYSSIMQYGGRAFSLNGEITIKANDPKYQNVLGNRISLSFNDIKLANLMYKCHENCDKKMKCPGIGFLGKDCRCYCPGSPVQLCSTSGNSVCEDIGPICEDLKKKGFCTDRYMNFMGTNCQSTCNYCNISIKADWKETELFEFSMLIIILSCDSLLLQRSLN